MLLSCELFPVLLTKAGEKSDGLIEDDSKNAFGFGSFNKDSCKMTYVVTSPCYGCKYTDCIVVCPCDCFREGDQMLYIDPTECIDCDQCVAECPVEAIFPEWDVPDEWKDFIQLNAEMSAKCPPITQKKTPLAGH
jgi:ferredoxin